MNNRMSVMVNSRRGKEGGGIYIKPRTGILQVEEPVNRASFHDAKELERVNSPKVPLFPSEDWQPFGR